MEGRTPAWIKHLARLTHIINREAAERAILWALEDNATRRKKVCQSLLFRVNQIVHNKLIASGIDNKRYRDSAFDLRIQARNSEVILRKLTLHTHDARLNNTWQVSGSFQTPPFDFQMHKQPEDNKKRQIESSEEWQKQKRTIHGPGQDHSVPVHSSAAAVVAQTLSQPSLGLTTSSNRIQRHRSTSSGSQVQVMVDGTQYEGTCILLTRSEIETISPQIRNAMMNRQATSRCDDEADEPISLPAWFDCNREAEDSRECNLVLCCTSSRAVAGRETSRQSKILHKSTADGRDWNLDWDHRCTAMCRQIPRIVRQILRCRALGTTCRHAQSQFKIASIDCSVHLPSHLKSSLTPLSSLFLISEQ